eukprot:gene26524-32557_t
MDGQRPYVEIYEEKKALGHGAHGTVVLAMNRETKHLVAVKKMNLGDMGDEKERKMCHNEVMLLRSLRLSCPNIINYVESFEEEGTFYIVTEYCEDGTLADHIKERRDQGSHFKDTEVFSIFMQLLIGLDHLHGKKIVHRDLKTQNIFLTKSFLVKLGDFGVSRAMGTQTCALKTVVGTPYYMSPELVQGTPYNSKSDVWALGCVLYELITLKKAFPGDNLAQVVMAIATGKYEPLPQGSLPELKQLVQGILVCDP